MTEDPPEVNDSSKPPEPHACPECGHEILVVSPVAPRRTDGRALGEWKSRYNDDGAITGIRVEAVYVAVVQFICVGLTIILLLNHELILPHISDAKEHDLGPIALAYLGGFFGGSLFSMKWLYHSVASGLWNRDRFLWRLYTPFISGGGALALVLLSSSSIVPIFGPEAMSDPAAVFGISIVLGYFSDRVFSALEGFAKQNLSAKKPANT